MADRTCGDAGGYTKAAAPCRSRLNLSPASGLCVMHDPARADETAAMRTRGGERAGAVKRLEKATQHPDVPKAPRTLQDAVDIAAWITRATLIGEIDVRVAEAATKAVRQFQLAHEKRVLEKEIAALRAELADARKRK